MSISNFAENKLLDHVTGRASYTMPTDVYVKLHTGDAGENGTSNAATNTDRKELTFAAASSGSIATTGTPSAEWTSIAAAETYSHWSLWDASTAGNCLWTGALSSSASVAIGDTFQITTLTLTLD
jgi:hypothetical protein